MNSQLLYGSISLLLGIYSFITWRKSKDKDFLWLMWVAFANFLIEIVGYIVLLIVPPSSYIISIDNVVLLVVGPIMILLTLWLLLKGTKRK
jgi:hypothetical protein